MDPKPQRGDVPPGRGLTALGAEGAPCVLIALANPDQAFRMAGQLAERGWRALRGGLTSDFPPGFRAIVSDDPPTLLFGRAVWPEALIVAVDPRGAYEPLEYQGGGVDWRLRGRDPLAEPEAWGPLAHPPT